MYCLYALSLSRVQDYHKILSKLPPPLPVSSVMGMWTQVGSAIELKVAARRFLTGMHERRAEQFSSEQGQLQQNFTSSKFIVDV